eukprot:5850059-Prymnesium_polylepis.1
MSPGKESSVAVIKPRKDFVFPDETSGDLETFVRVRRRVVDVSSQGPWPLPVPGPAAEHAAVSDGRRRRQAA